MQSIYLLDADPSQFRSVLGVDEDSLVDLVKEFDGTPIGTTWKAVNANYEDIHLPLGDFPNFGFAHIPVFSSRAAAALAPLLVASGELLPLKVDDSEYFAFNVTVLVDALNVEASDIVRFPSGRIMDVKTYVLEGERLGSAAIFKLRETPLMDVFVTDEFVAATRTAGLKGFTFKHVKIL